MKERLNNAVASVKEFVAEHKTTLAVTATAAICLAVNRVALAQHNEFLKEHELYELYYNPEEEI